MKTQTTKRGFRIIEFSDSYAQECSIQKSSIIDPECIWLGVDNTGAQIKGANGEYKCDGNRMHLTQKQVEFLIPILQKFVKNGELPTIYKPI